MPLKQQIAVILFLLGFMGFVFNLVRTRRLRVAYSAFWLLAGVVMIILVIRYDWLVALTHLLGIVLPTSTILFLGFLFIFAVEVQVARTLTKNHHAIQKLTQELGILAEEVNRLKAGLEDNSPPEVEKRGEDRDTPRS